MLALIQDGVVVAYPYTVAAFRVDHPRVGLPAQPTTTQLEEVGLFPVLPSAAPSDSIDLVWEEAPPVLVNGVWTQQWVSRPAGPQEIAQRQQEIRDRITRRVQQRLDDFARTRGYDDIVSACSYATSTHAKYGPEGRYCVTAREETWDVMFSIEAQVQSGLRPIPLTYEEIESELPVLAWPV